MKLLAATALAAPALGSLINVELSKSSEYFQLNSNSTLTCSYSFNQEAAEGLDENPAFALTWSKDGQDLVTFSSIDQFAAIPHFGSGFDASTASLDQEAKTSTLSLNGVAIADRGDFACDLRLLKSQVLKESQERAYFSSQAAGNVEVYQTPSATSTLNSASFDTRNDQVNDNDDVKQHVIAACGVEGAYPAPEKVELQIGNRRLARNAIDFTAVANEAGIFSVSDIEFTDNLQGVNDDGATVTCLVSHQFWGAEPIKSASEAIEVLYLPEEVEVVYAGEQGAVAYALEGQNIEISCQAVSNPNVNLELHEGQYAPQPVPEVVEEATQAAEVASEAEEQDSEVEDEAQEEADDYYWVDDEAEAEDQAEDEVEAEVEAEAEDEAEDETDALLTNADHSRRRRNATDEATAAPATAAPVEVTEAADPTVSRSAVRGENIEYSCRAYDAQFNFNIWSQAVSLPVYYLDAPVLSGPSGKQSPNTEISFSCASENFVGDNEVTYTLMLEGEEQASQSTPDFTVTAAQGQYSCSVSAANVEGLSPQTSEIFDVELKNVCQYSSARPKIEYSSKTKGEKLVSILTCPLLAGSEDCSIEWHYSADKFKAQKKDGNKLVIENLVVSDSDRISCLAKNEAGSSQRVWLDNGDVKEIEAKSNNVVIFIIVAILLVVIYVAFSKYRAKKSHEKKMAAAAEESVSLRG